MTTALNMASTFRCEPDLTIWSELRTQLSNIGRMIEESCYTSCSSVESANESPAESALKAFSAFIAGGTFQKLGEAW